MGSSPGLPRIPSGNTIPIRPPSRSHSTALDKQNLRGNSVYASLAGNPGAIFFATPTPRHTISICVKQLRIGNGDIRSERWVRHENVDSSETDLFTGDFNAREVPLRKGKRIHVEDIPCRVCHH